MGDKDDNISIIETRKSKPLKNIKFAFEVNEMAWDLSGKQFFLTTGGGTVEVFSYEQMLKPGPAESARTLHAHTANCYCIEFSPSGEYFAVGGADALVSLWSLQARTSAPLHRYALASLRPCPAAPLLPLRPSAPCVC